MTVSNISIPDLLLVARRLFTNALATDEIKGELVPDYFEEAGLAEGAALVEEVQRLSGEQQRERTEADEAVDAAQAAAAQVVARYTAHRKFARRIYPRSSDHYGTLGLAGSVPTNRAGLFAAAFAFWTKLKDRPDLAAPIPGVNDASITRGLGELAEAQRLDAAQKKEEGEASGATDARDAQVADLRRQTGTLATVCEEVFKNRPGLLDQLGLS